MDDTEQLKITINTFVWMNAPGGMTLDAADSLASEIYRLFEDARRDWPRRCEHAKSEAK